jgi:hypothetical protein
MANEWSRRSLLRLAAVALPLGKLASAKRMSGPEAKDEEESVSDDAATVAQPSQETVTDLFPTQPPELAREMVTVAHYDLKRVKELAEERPSLARASWDWGFGDWEDALGGASHMGNRPIAEYLISKGARPTLFSAAMLGQLEVVRAFVTAQPGVQRIRGPHSISLLAHAKAGGDAARPVFDFLQSVGDADADPQAPVSESDADAVKGTYVFGSGMSQQIDVTMEQMPVPGDMRTVLSQLIWTRKGMMGRPLFHLGRRVFYPWGAPSVRIQFTDDGGEAVMTIHDPDVVLVARRKA